MVVPCTLLEGSLAALMSMLKAFWLCCGAAPDGPALVKGPGPADLFASVTCFVPTDIPGLVDCAASVASSVSPNCPAGGNSSALVDGSALADCSACRDGSAPLEGPVVEPSFDVFDDPVFVPCTTLAEGIAACVVSDVLEGLAAGAALPKACMRGLTGVKRSGGCFPGTPYAAQACRASFTSASRWHACSNAMAIFSACFGKHDCHMLEKPLWVGSVGRGNPLWVGSVGTTDHTACCSGNQK